MYMGSPDTTACPDMIWLYTVMNIHVIGPIGDINSYMSISVPVADQCTSGRSVYQWPRVINKHQSSEPNSLLVFLALHIPYETTTVCTCTVCSTYTPTMREENIFHERAFFSNSYCMLNFPVYYQMCESRLLYVPPTNWKYRFHVIYIKSQSLTFWHAPWTNHIWEIWNGI